VPRPHSTARGAVCVRNSRSIAFPSGEFV